MLFISPLLLRQLDLAKAFDYLAIVLDSFNIIKTYKNMYIKQKDGFSFDKDWSILFLLFLSIFFNFFKKQYFLTFS